MKNNANPFKRFSMLMQAISAAMATGLKGLMLQQEIQQLASKREFQSLGKGGGHRPQGSRMKAAAKLRAQRNKFEPHQVKREIERRLRQMERDWSSLEARAAAQGFGLVAGGAA